MTSKQEKLIENYVRQKVKKMLKEDANSSSYYKDQLNKITIDPEYGAKVKFFSGNSGGQDSNSFSLNVESIPIIINWLKANLKKFPKSTE